MYAPYKKREYTDQIGAAADLVAPQVIKAKKPRTANSELHGREREREGQGEGGEQKGFIRQSNGRLASESGRACGRGVSVRR